MYVYISRPAVGNKSESLPDLELVCCTSVISLHYWHVSDINKGCCKRAS